MDRNVIFPDKNKKVNSCSLVADKAKLSCGLFGISKLKYTK